MNFKHIVETPSGYRRDIILMYSFFMANTGYDRIRALMGDDDFWFYQLISIHYIGQFTIGQFLIVPPVVVFGPPISVNGKSPANTKYIVAAKGRPTVFDPEGVSLASSGTIVVSTNEEVLPLGHVVVGRVAIGFVGTRVDESDSKIPNLQGTVAPFNDVLKFTPFRVDISNESNLHFVFWRFC
jgi:hypothetical protein